MTGASFPRPRILLLEQDDSVSAAAVPPWIAVTSLHPAQPLVAALLDACDLPGGGRSPVRAAGSRSDVAGAGSLDGVALLDRSVRADADRDAWFLTRIFASARLREVVASRRPAALTDFHAAYKYLLLACDERGMRVLGRTAAAVSRPTWNEVLQTYRDRFARALAAPPGPAGHVNALTHVFGHLSRRLNAAERQLFLATLDEVAAGRWAPSVAQVLLRGWIARFDVPYLARQAYLEPFPAEIGGELTAEVPTS